MGEKPCKGCRGIARKGRYCRPCFNRRAREKAYATPTSYFKRILAAAKHRAKKKGLECDLTLEDLEDLYDEGGHKCAVTRVPLKIPQASRPLRSREDLSFRFYSPSVDRVDSTAGYVKGNVRITSCGFNLMAGAMTDTQLVHMCERVLEARDSRGFGA